MAVGFPVCLGRLGLFFRAAQLSDSLVAAVWLFPRGKYNWKQTVAAIVLFALAGNCAYRLPYDQFAQDKDV